MKSICRNKALDSKEPLKNGKRICAFSLGLIFALNTGAITVSYPAHASTGDKSVSISPESSNLQEIENETDSISTSNGSDLSVKELANSNPSLFEGQVTEMILLHPVSNIDQLVENACNQTELANKIDKKNGKNRRGIRKVIYATKDITQWATSYTGFEASSEAADIILDEKIRLKSSASLDYARQKQYDETHSAVVAAMMQIAMGLGMTNKERGESSIGKGKAQLVALLGESEAERTVKSMRDWAATIDTVENIEDRDSGDIFDLQKRSQRIVSERLKNDDVVQEIHNRLHKYNSHSNFMRVTAKVVNSALSVAAFSPTFVAPAAQLAQMAFIMATGGPEEAKLLKELYLDKRLGSRLQSLMTEATLAVNNHNLALVTKNPVLLSFSERIVEEMTSEECAEAIFSDAELPRTTSTDKEVIDAIELSAEPEADYKPSTVTDDIDTVEMKDSNQSLSKTAKSRKLQSKKQISKKSKEKISSRKEDQQIKHDRKKLSYFNPRLGDSDLETY